MKIKRPVVFKRVDVKKIRQRRNFNTDSTKISIHKELKDEWEELETFSFMKLIMNFFYIYILK